MSKFSWHCYFNIFPVEPGEGGADGVGLPYLLVDERVEHGQQEEGDQVEEDQVQPVDVHLQTSHNMVKRHFECNES